MNIFLKNHSLTYIIRLFLFLNFLFSESSFQFSAESSSGYKDGNENVTLFDNNVIIKNDEMILYADQAKNYKESQKILVSGNVKMYHQKDTLMCNKLLILQNNGTKYQAEDSIIFIQDKLQATCTNLIYWPENNNIKASLSGDVKLNDFKKSLTCNQLIIYADDNEKIEANDNIFLKLSNQRAISCERLFFWNLNNNIEAFSNVEVVDSSLKILGDSLYINYQDSLIDRIKLFSNTKIINDKYVYTDSSKLKFPVQDMMEGSYMDIHFDNKEQVSKIGIYGMADIHFNIVKNQLFEGINNISGDTVHLVFNNNMINQMEILSGAIGEFIPVNKSTNLDSTIIYSADKIIYDIDQETSILSNNASIQYGQTILEGGFINANWANNIIESKEYNDIIPKVVTPSNQNPMYGNYMVFDLSTNQGKIINGYTDIGIGIFKGSDNQEIFREENNTVHIKNSIFTSCELDHPHYYFYSEYMKMIPDDKIIAKPMTLYINEFPTFHLPFAIFPNTNNQRRSGWIMPSFGNRSSSGTYIDDLGYYWAPNDYMDFKTLIDFEDKRGLYTKNEFRYNKLDGNQWFNYNMHGSLYFENKIILLENIDDFSYLFNEDSTRTIQNIVFKHNQSFDPTQNLAVNYNYKSERDTNEVDLRKRLDQTLTSNFNYVKRWDNSTITIGYYQYENLFVPPPDSLNQEQIYKYNSGPNITYNLNSKKIFGNGDNWYNKIYLSYNLNYNYGKNNYYKSSFLNAEEIIWDDNNSEYIAGGLRNHVKLSMSNKFGWLSIIPSLSIKEDWITKFATSSNDEPEQVIYKRGFTRRNTWSFNLNANTKIYGIIPINIGSVQSVRHKISPEFSLSFQPNFTDSNDGVIDPFYNSFLGSASSGYSRLTFWLRNSFQAKIKNNSGEYIKRDILSYDFTISYDPDRENIGNNNLSNLSSFLSFKKANGGEFLSIQMQHSFYNEYGDFINLSKKELPELKYFNAQISTNFNLSGRSYIHNAQFSQNENENTKNSSDSLLSILDYSPQMKDKKWETDFYFNLSGGYKEQTEKWDLSYCNIEARTTFELTKNWLLTHAALFNLTDMKIQSQSIRFHRPLHCWNFGFTWWPSGYSKGFRLEISINQPDLQDIKITSSSSNRRFGN